MESWKEPRKGSEKESETLCLQAAKAPYECDSVLFVERSGELLILARLNTNKVWSRRETESEKGEKLVLVDPKPGDLSMSRLKEP